MMIGFLSQLLIFLSIVRGLSLACGGGGGSSSSSSNSRRLLSKKEMMVSKPTTPQQQQKERQTELWNSYIRDIISTTITTTETSSRNTNNIHQDDPRPSSNSLRRFMEFADAIWNVHYMNPGRPSHQQHIIHKSMDQKCDAPYPNLIPVKPLHEIDDFIWSSQLESNWKIVETELRTYLQKTKTKTTKASSGGSIDPDHSHHRRHHSSEEEDEEESYDYCWKTSETKLCDDTNGFTKLTLMDDEGKPTRVGKRYFPKTLHLLQNVVGPNNLAPRPININCQGPNTGLAKHSDNMNFLLTCHLGLIVPTKTTTTTTKTKPKTKHDEDGHAAVNGEEGSDCCCIFRIGSNPQHDYQWKEGKLMIADTSFVHETFNTSPNQSRYVLSFNIWHPDLSLQERQGIVKLHSILQKQEF